MRCSVIICTHNPRLGYLRRTLEALDGQTLPKCEWELLLVDNASREKLAKTLDLSWHPQARVIQEEELGLTPARLRGVKEAKTDLLVLVDDDNVLAADYLAKACEISRDWPILGAWGSGTITGEYEVDPPEWMRPHLGALCIGSASRDVYGNTYESPSPCGAGMCVRKHVADFYVKSVQQDPVRRLMDRRGEVLTASGDGDLAWCAIDCGLGVGRFYQLKITHLIPKSRLQRNYILKIFAGFSYSMTILGWIRFNSDKRFPSFTRRIIAFLRAFPLRDIFQAQIYCSRWYAEQKAIRFIEREVQSRKSNPKGRKN